MWRLFAWASSRTKRLRRFIKLSREAWILYRSDLFDSEWYRVNYPDVKASGIHPLKHYLLAGAAEGRDPSLVFSTRAYLGRNPDVAAQGSNPLVHFLRYGRREGRQGIEGRSPTAPQAVLRQQFNQLCPLRAVRLGNRSDRRVTLLTDSVSSGSLYGGVGTGLLLAVAICNRLHATLRIVTECEPADRARVAAVFTANGTYWQDDIDFCYAPRGDRNCGEVELRDEDLFLTTSWWNTWNVRQSVLPQQIIYLLQEDERMFYPHGDQHLRCSETLKDPEIRFVINSRMLFEHLINDGFNNIERHGIWFEPSFPKSGYYFEDRTAGSDGKRIFFFYARPVNQRNLYSRGLEAIVAALEEGVLDPSEWEIVFAGRDLSPVSLPGGISPRLVQNVPWHKYMELIRQVDLGLSLMYTPHPSYPPLDLAASGAVAVTNQYGRKLSLTQYSKNIICVPCDVDSLVGGITRGVALAIDGITRRYNYETMGLSRDWTTGFAPVLQHLFAHAEV
jgi:hypothetical protein